MATKQKLLATRSIQSEVSTSVSAQIEKLGLRISHDSRSSKVKVYDLVPEVGIVRGFGANIQDRDDLIDVLEFRQLLRNDGLYLLFKQMSVIYVGISQKIKSRLTSHKYRRDWDRVIAFYSVREVLNPNITGYVEYKLYELLSKRGFKLDQNSPEECYLSQHDEIVMRQIIQEIDRVLQLLDLANPPLETALVAMTESPPKGQEESILKAAPRGTAIGKDGIEVELVSRKAQAIAIYSDLGLEVLAGAEGTAKVAPHAEKNKFYHSTVEKLVRDKVIEIRDGRIRFLQSFIFTSPTAAALILTGSNRPGPLVWRRTSDKRTLKELDDLRG
jgi:hypothetical protein